MQKETSPAPVFNMGKSILPWIKDCSKTTFSGNGNNEITRPIAAATDSGHQSIKALKDGLEYGRFRIEVASHTNFT